MPLILAHFSDFHLGRASVSKRRQRHRTQALIDHALERGAEHLLFGGDLVDHGNLEDARWLAKVLDARGFLRADRASVVPGNHDLWPMGEDTPVRDALEYVAGNARSVLVRSDWPAQERYEELQALFSSTFDGSAPMYEDGAFPCIKKVGPLTLALLDTTSDRGSFNCASGRFCRAEAAWLLRELKGRTGPRMLLMHHWPWKIEFDYSELSWARRQVARRVDPNFPSPATVRRFIGRGGFDAVLCGHLHLMGDDPTDEAEFVGEAFGVPVHCMGRSGGVHQDSDPTLAYHLISVGTKRVAVETIHVPASQL